MNTYLILWRLFPHFRNCFTRTSLLPLFKEKSGNIYFSTSIHLSSCPTSSNQRFVRRYLSPSTHNLITQISSFTSSYRSSGLIIITIIRLRHPFQRPLAYLEMQVITANLPNKVSNMTNKNPKYTIIPFAYKKVLNCKYIHL